MQLDVFAVDVGATRTKFGVVKAADRVVWLDAVPTPLVDLVYAEHIRALHLDHAPGLPLVVAWPGPSNTGSTLDEIREALDRSGPRARAVVGDMIAAATGEAGTTTLRCFRSVQESAEPWSAQDGSPRV